MQCANKTNKGWRCFRPAKVGLSQRGLPYQWCERCRASNRPASRASAERQADRIEARIGMRHNYCEREIKLIEDAQRVARISNTTDITTIGVQCTEEQPNE